MDYHFGLQEELLKIEFVDPLLIPDQVVNPFINLNCQELERPAFELYGQSLLPINESFGGIPHNCDAADPLELPEIKQEPIECETDTFAVNLEVVKADAVDVGDHYYALTRQDEHNYAKILKKYSSENIDRLKNAGAKFAVKKEIVTDDERKNNLLNSISEGYESFEFSQIPHIKRQEESLEIKEVKHEIDHACNEFVEEQIFELNFGCKEILEDVSNKVSDDCAEKNTILANRKPYAKKKPLLANKELPLNPLELSQVIDLPNDSSNNEMITATDNQSLAQRRSLQEHVKKHVVQKTFKCNQCDFQGAGKWHLDKHMRIHARAKLFKCPICPYSGVFRYNLIKHLEKHADIVPYVCETCGFRSREESAMAAHRKMHMGTLMCRLCGFQTAKTFIMESHMVKHLRKKSYRCYECDFVSWYRNELAAHRLTHLKMVRCNVCKVQMLGKAYEEHLKIHQVKCRECGYVAANDRVLRIHMTNLHNWKSLKCASCNFATQTRSKFLQHMESHTHEKPYKCMKCGYSATTSSDVNNHMKKHTLEVPYKCIKCPYKTTFSVDLLKHMQTHSDDSAKTPNNKQHDSKTVLKNNPPKPIIQKSLKCTECSVLCKSQTELDNHFQFAHSRFDCKVCGRKELLWTELQKHLKFHLQNLQKNLRAKKQISKEFKRKFTMKTYYMCSSCDFVIDNRIDMRKHMRIHMFEKQKAYDCASPVRTFAKRTEEKGKLQMYKCGSCNYTTGNERALRQHVKKKHNL